MPSAAKLANSLDALSDVLLIAAFHFLKELRQCFSKLLESRDAFIRYLIGSSYLPVNNLLLHYYVPSLFQNFQITCKIAVIYSWNRVFQLSVLDDDVTSEVLHYQHSKGVEQFRGCICQGKIVFLY